MTVAERETSRKARPGQLPNAPTHGRPLVREVAQADAWKPCERRHARSAASIEQPQTTGAEPLGSRGAAHPRAPAFASAGRLGAIPAGKTAMPT